VLQNCLNPNSIYRTVGKWQVMAIGDDIRDLAAVDVRADKRYIWISMNGFGSYSDRRAADDQNFRMVSELTYRA
jgi:hypothetical protein